MLPTKASVCRINDPRETTVSGEKKNGSEKKYAPQKSQESRTQANIFKGAK